MAVHAEIIRLQVYILYRGNIQPFQIEIHPWISWSLKNIRNPYKMK